MRTSGGKFEDEDDPSSPAIAGFDAAACRLAGRKMAGTPLERGMFMTSNIVRFKSIT
jgi:hypothetical protein